jgi:hypothetical protein
MALSESEVLEKHPSDDLVYTFDFSEWEFLTASEKIVSATVTGSPSGLTIGAASINSDGDQVQVRISAGTADTTYHVKCQATTTSGYDIVGCAILLVNNC